MALLVTALRGREQILGPDHPQTVGLRKVLERCEATADEPPSSDAADGLGAEEREDGREAAHLVALLMHVYIAPAHRRKGAGRQAVDAMAQLAWEAQASLMAAVVAESNVTALSLLKGSGFELESESSLRGEVHQRLVRRPPKLVVAQKPEPGGRSDGGKPMMRTGASPPTMKGMKPPSMRAPAGPPPAPPQPKS